MKSLALLFSVAIAIGALVLPTSALPASAQVVASQAEKKVSASVIFGPADSGVLTPGQDLALSGTITNSTTTDLAAGKATAYLDRAVVSSRADLTAWTGAGDAVAVDKLGAVIGSTDTPEIPAGRTVTVSFPIAAAAIGLSDSAAFGARTIAVNVSSGDAVVGQSRSTIVWQGSTAFTPVTLDLAMPLTAPAATTGLIPAETLATYTAVNGLLTRELDQAIDRHIAIGIDPRLIASINVLGTSAPHSAVAWLARLQAATNETFPLSYADSDVAALSQAGLRQILAPTTFSIDPKLFPGHTAPPTASPTASPSSVPDPNVTPAPALPTTETLTDWPYTAALSSMVWPADDSVVEQDLDTWQTEQYGTTILSSGNVSYGDLDYTPSAAATIDKHAVIVSDAQISALFRTAAAAPDEFSWQNAMANLSAGIAGVVRQRDGDIRSVLATIGRGTPGTDGHLAQTLEALSALPWVGFGKLADLVSGSTPTVSATVDAKAESADRLATVRALLASEVAVGSFSSVLTDPTVLTGERRLSLLATLDNAWAIDPPAWRTATDKYLKTSETTLTSVKITQSGSLFVPAAAVSLVVAVTNDLAWPVTVFVTLVSPSGAIEVQKPRVELVVEANSQAKASISVRAIANGQVMVRASLASATNVPIGTTKSLDVDVQAGWEGVFIGIVAILIAGVFGFGIYRNVQRLRRRRRADPEPPPAP
jgi:hypothetical protein